MPVYAQITNLCLSAHFHLQNIRVMRNLLTDSAAAQLLHALVTSRIDYCYSVLYSFPDYKLNKLKSVHNIACRIVCNISKFDHITQHIHVQSPLGTNYNACSIQGAPSKISKCVVSRIVRLFENAIGEECPLIGCK